LNLLCLRRRGGRRLLCSDGEGQQNGEQTEYACHRRFSKHGALQLRKL
jgi:hypothetical protein